MSDYATINRTELEVHNLLIDLQKDLDDLNKQKIFIFNEAILQEIDAGVKVIEWFLQRINILVMDDLNCVVVNMIRIEHE